jgi:hypothetical protein
VRGKGRRWFGKRSTKAAVARKSTTKEQTGTKYVVVNVSKDRCNELINGTPEYDSDTLVEATLVEGVPEATLVVTAEVVIPAESEQVPACRLSWGAFGSATATIGGGVCTGIGASGFAHGALALDLCMGGGMALVCGLVGVAFIYAPGTNVDETENEENDGLLPHC